MGEHEELSLSVSKVNKARIEAQTNYRDLMHRHHLLEVKVKEKDDLLAKDVRKIHELDFKILDLEKQMLVLETEK